MSGPAGQDHVSATPRKLNGGGFAQAAVGAGHQADPAVNPHIIRNRGDFRVLRLPEVPDRGEQRAESRAVSMSRFFSPRHVLLQPNPSFATM